MKFSFVLCLLQASLPVLLLHLAVGAASRSVNASSLASSSEEEFHQQAAPPTEHESDGAGPERSKHSGDLTFYHALIASLSVIIVSELGDKTWFIAAIMAMRHSRLTVFSGMGWLTQVIPRFITYYISTALFALFGVKMLYEGYRMSPAEGQEEYEEAKAEIQKKELLLDSSKISDMETGMGWLTQVIPRFITYYISTALFALFGVKMLYEGYRMSPAEGQEEYEEAKAEIQKKELLLDSSKISDMESGSTTSTKQDSTYALVSFVSTLFLEAFTLTFLAEWGDRSQLTTIVLAARENVYGVVIGGILGHALCTGIAVIGGKLVATQISVRTGKYFYIFQDY
ncbi:unnamed protein product [Gongylonema pulchrum]|uniref:GDT1 family protein n=1 Tax=Gongylonema pulchrum TaxID=637853 RepID=A0A183DQJ9_9BILA|nr:unnamed protein product [Gongylonema pulchrum]